MASSQEKLVPSSISSNVSSTCSEISTAAAFTDLSNLSSDSSSSSSSSSDEDSSSSRQAADDESTCETRTLRDEQATPIMDPELYACASVPEPGRYPGHTQVGEYELVDNHQHLATPHSPSTPDLLYPHTHLTNSLAGQPAASLPINQNGLPVFDHLPILGRAPQPPVQPPSAEEEGQPDLDLDLERQHAMFYSSDLLNSNNVNLENFDETLSNVGSADHLIHGGHFLSVNNSRPFLQGSMLFIMLMSPK